MTTVMEARMTRRGRVVLVLALVLGAVLLAVLVRRPAGEGDALDPGGTGPLGTKGLVLLLREGGNDVRVSARTPDPGRSSAVLLSDTLDRARSEALEGWVREGGTLVVADPSSPLGRVTPYRSPVTGSAGATTIRDGCPAVPALAGVREIDVHGALVFERGGRAPGSVSCFAVDGGDFLVVTPLGRGTVVALGGAGVWVNGNLDDRGNAGLAVALLAPRPGAAVQVLSDLAPDAGDARAVGPAKRSVGDLLPEGFAVARIQVLLTFLAAVIWRARRLGRPVVEAQPVPLPGSELVVAVGRLHQRAGHRRAAAAVLAGRASRRVADRLGVPRSSSAATLAAIVAARTGRDGRATEDVLSGARPADDADLVRAAAAGDAIVADVLDPTPRTGGST